MCGIAVTIDLPRGSGTKARDHLCAFEVTKGMVDRLHPRGPDDASTTRVVPPENNAPNEIGPEIVLGHTRLAVVGGSEAKSPFVWSKQGGGRVILVHNGEIYNHQQLRQQLIEEEYCAPSDFSTECDSEVLLACCAERGVEWTLRHATGMFAFVLVELAQGQCSEGHDPPVVLSRVVVARDTFGIKPLICAFDDSKSRIVFASQISAISPLEFDESSVHIKDIPPGTYIEYTFHSEYPSLWTYAYKVHQYISNDFDSSNALPGHRIEGISNSYSFEDKAALDNLREKLIDAVSCRIPPPGSAKTAVLLSGGLDSSLITSIAARLLGNKKLHTFNISFQYAVGTDQEYARIVKDHLPNIKHEEVTFSFQEGLEVLPQVIECLEKYDAVSVRAGVPLYLLSKRIKSLGFKVILCGEGADEVFGGYRLFEAFQPSNHASFTSELCRRLEHIDTSELQRVDRCTSNHGLEARVPFLDLAFVSAAMKFAAIEKMSHISLGRIQKYILRLAFSSRLGSTQGQPWLPDSVLFREKEQLADGVGRGWINSIQDYAIHQFEGIKDGEKAENALYNKLFELGRQKQVLHSDVRLSLVKDRQQRRQQGRPRASQVRTGAPQPSRWYSAANDEYLNNMALTDDDIYHFLSYVLGWKAEYCTEYTPTLDTLNRLIASMLQRVPFHNLTLLVRERRPPTAQEIKEDMMAGLGGPCAVVNTFFAALLVAMGFGPNVYLLSCEINGREDCHVGILVQIVGLRYFIDVANAKPYAVAVHLGDSTLKKSLNNSFERNLSFNENTKRIEVLHFGKMALSFDPTVTVRVDSFHDMIKRSRSDPTFGPFLTSLRFCLYSKEVTLIKAVRGSTIYDGRLTTDKSRALSKDEIRSFATENFYRINGFCDLVDEAISILDRDCPDWFDEA